MSQIIDISPKISENSPVWPGDTPFKRIISLSKNKGDNIDLSSITTTLHIGSHADAPSHYKQGGESIADVCLTKFLGSCVVVKYDGESREIPLDFIEGIWDEYQPFSRILLRTDSFDHDREFSKNFVWFSPSSIEFLGKKGVVLVGIDTPSFDSFSSKELPAHQMLAKYQIANLEGLHLKSVTSGLYELIALPLAISGADASPVRAVLRKSTR